ncbi:MAG: hypothetical protein LUH10_03705 [Tannerellaceae bacterium]|nr:hypothetical protein [Tannerellaceae bacterium]
MKKNFIYVLITLVCCVMFTGCEKDDERALVVNKSWLTGAKWYDFWDDGLTSYDQMFIFNQDGYGYELYTKDGYTEVYEFEWRWRSNNSYMLDIRFFNGDYYEWDVMILDYDILTFYWGDEEVTYFPI